MLIQDKILRDNPFIKQSEVLIVDDSNISICLITKHFESIGIKNISVAKNGLEALKKLEQSNPSLIVTDLYMPEMDGYELVKRIRKMPHLFEVPVLIQTSASQSDEINKAYVVGANDVILKPVQKEEFIAKSLFHIESSVFRRRIKQELGNAIELQKSIMPSEEKIEELAKEYNLDLSVLFAPSSEIGGDFWGFSEVSHSELAIYNVDISGHGVASAMNALRIHSLMEDKASLLPLPDLYTGKLNKKVNDIMPVGQYATMFFGIINIEDNYLEYCNAASPLPIIIRKNGEEVILEGSNLPIGVDRNVKYKSNRVEFNQGDVLLLFSDALNESTNEQGEFFNQSKISKVIKKSHNLDSKGIMEELLKKFNAFCDGNKIDDDLTINIYKRT